MSLLTCKGCQRILDVCEFPIKDKDGRRSNVCRTCSNRRVRDLYHKAHAGNWLFMGCIHLPFEHPDALDWLASLKKKYLFERVVMMGDLYDWGGLNKFMKNPNMPSPIAEYERTKEVRARLFDMFPVVDMIYGNHDIRPYARAGEAFLPDLLVRPIDEVMGLPEGWKRHGSMLEAKHKKLGDILIMHGDKLHKDAVVNAKSCGRHFVMADRHTMCKAAWVETILGEKRFGINTGCLIDADREAFAYSRGRMMRPIVAVGAIIDNSPVNLVMPMDKEYRWVDR